MKNSDIDPELLSPTNIREIANLLIKDNQLTDYVHDVKVVNDKYKNIISYYDINSKIITLYLDNILNGFYSYYSIHLNLNNKSNAFGMYLLDTILYELSFAKQAKIADEKGNDSLHIIAREGISFYKKYPDSLSVKDKLLIQTCNKRLLCNRKAECDRQNDLIKLNNELYLFDKNEISHVKEGLNYSLSYGYTSKSACENFYFIIGKQDEFKKIPFDEDYDDYTRKSWGMPLVRKK